jgi:prepilin-type N-terminal cleavage/methylation domain-containing protein
MIKVQRGNKGFTLIELLIVIAIIGILAAIAIPSYTGYTKKAKVQEVIHAIGAVKTAVMAYYTESGVVSPNLTTLTLINTNLGIQVPDKYLTSMTIQGNNTWAPNDGMITAVFYTGANTATKKAIGSGVDAATIVLTPDSTYKNWSWSSPDAGFQSYLPKS